MRNLIIIFSLCVSCNLTNKKEITSGDVPINSKDSLMTSLLGKWGTIEGKPIWEIKKDSLYYFNEKKSYFLMIHEKDIIVLHEQGIFQLKEIKVEKDTLFFKVPDGGYISSFRIRP